MARKNRTEYSSAQAQDGTWTIFDVPVFAELVDDRREETFRVDLGWLMRAFARGKTREREGYLPPVHVRHHGDADGVDEAGHFRFARIGPIQHGGKTVHAIFVDLVGVGPKTYDAIRKGKLAYRSVEILDPDTAEIDSLALLDHEVPFLRLPLLRVTSERPVALAQNTPALCYQAASSGPAVAVLFRFQETTMADEDKDKDDDDKKDMKSYMEDEVLAILKAIAAKLGIGAEEEAEEAEVEEEAPAMAAAVEVATPGANLSASSPETEGALVGMQAKLAQLEAQLAARDQADRLNKIATDMSARNLPAEAVGKFRAMAKAHGEDRAIGFAQAAMSYGPGPDPSPTWTGEVRGASPADAPEVAAFAAQGPEALERARDLHASWTRTQSQVPFADYLAINTDAGEFLGLARS